MAVYTIDPLIDERWPQFLDLCPNSSVFHTRGWLKALRFTYGYEPIVYTTSGPSQELTNGIPFCRIKSWLTGKRMVSLPFSDHCQPLIDDPNHLNEILGAIHNNSEKKPLKYVELRPIISEASTYRGQDYGENTQFYFHAIDLSEPLDSIYSRCHKTAIQQMIQRAEREQLVLEEGRSERHLKMFFDMLLMTRRRHQVPPQPLDWFSNVLNCIGEPALIRIALRDDVPIAAILTISYKTVHYYKYGCSDPHFNNLGGTPFLIWRTILEAKEQGASLFDMGRSDPANTGLVNFKDRWGAKRLQISYYRFPSSIPSETSEGWKIKLAKQLFSRLPDSMMAAAGKALYRHVG